MRRFSLKNFSLLWKKWVKQNIKKERKNYTYVALGDSAAEGIGASDHSKSYTGLIYTIIKEKFKNTRYYNYAKFGARVEEIFKDQLPEAIKKEPDLVTISVGANDIKTKVKLNDFKKQLTDLIVRLQTETNAKIAINNLPDFSLVPSLPLHLRFAAKIQIKRFNKAIYEVADRYSVIFVDLNMQSHVYVKKFPETIGDDKFHPSDFGHALWANTVATAIYHHIFSKDPSK